MPALRGLLLGSLSLVVPVKPFANEVRDDACCDRRQELNEVDHDFTPSRCRYGVGQRTYYTSLRQNPQGVAPEEPGPDFI